MEVYRLKGHHVFSGKDIDMVFLVRRRKHQRPIDVIMREVDLGGVHITDIKRIPSSKLPRVIPIHVTPASMQVIHKK